MCELPRLTAFEPFPFMVGKLAGVPDAPEEGTLERA